MITNDKTIQQRLNDEGHCAVFNNGHIKTCRISYKRPSLMINGGYFITAKIKVYTVIYV